MLTHRACGTTYADKLASCTPFRCQKPGLMAIGIPSDKALKEMSPKQRQQLEKQKVSTEEKLKKMSPEKRAAMKARMTSLFEIKGFNAQGQCRTETIAMPSQRMDCLFDKSALQKVSEYSRLIAKATDFESDSTSHVVNGKMVTESTVTIDGVKVTDEWTTALNNGQCIMMIADADVEWASMSQMNWMSHFEFNLLEHGKHVDGHIQILNTADGKVLFDKDVKTSKSMRKINLKPGTFDIKVVSMNPQLSPVWFRGIKLGEAGAFEKNIEFYAITGTLKLTVNVNGKKSNFGVYMTDPETQKWIFKAPNAIGKKPLFQFSPASITLPESLSGRYDVFVATVPERSFKVPDDAKYKQFHLTIKNGETVEKTLDFGQLQTVVESVKTSNSGSFSKVVPKPKFPTTDANGMEQNTDRPEGALIRHFSPASDDPVLCQKACREDARCKAWTYVKPNTVQGASPNCWLKSDVARAYPNACCISGLVKHP